MGIEPTNRGFADHLSNHCNFLNLKELTLNSVLVGPGLGPTLRLVLHSLLVGQIVPSRAALPNERGGQRRIGSGVR